MLASPPSRSRVDCGSPTEDQIAIVFCGSKKSLASGLPLASVLLPAATAGVMVVPLMMFHQIQLIVCAWLARRYGAPRPGQVATEFTANSRARTALAISAPGPAGDAGTWPRPGHVPTTGD